eukprot:Rhum_TRINITY_DN9163_c0_g2::Rhum_TRINITY_DN9163_c0_g2_i1::g.31889::m.31889
MNGGQPPSRTACAADEEKRPLLRPSNTPNATASPSAPTSSAPHGGHTSVNVDAYTDTCDTDSDSDSDSASDDESCSRVSASSHRTPAHPPHPVLLPMDCLAVVFTYLPTMRAVLLASASCRAWRTLGLSDVLWRAPYKALKESARLGPPCGRPVEELAEVSEAFETCKLEGENLPSSGTSARDVWQKCVAPPGHALSSEGSFGGRYHAKYHALCAAGTGGAASVARAQKWCCAPIANRLDRFAVPFILVFFIVTFVFGTLPAEREHTFQSLSLCVLAGEYHTDTPPPVTVAPEVLTHAPAPGDGSSSSTDSSSSLGFDWMIQQLVLIPLAGWRLTTWSRVPSLVFCGAAMRVVHVFLAFAPSCLVLAPKLNVYHSCSLVCVFVR